jgi:hypothetical protein
MIGDEPCQPSITFQVHNKRNLSSINLRTMPCAYLEDTDKRDQGWAFLGRGATPSGLHEDDRAITPIACRPLGVVFVNTSTTPVPHRPDDTSVRWGCSNKPVDGLVFTRGCFDQRAPTMIPAHLLKMSWSEGKHSCGGEWGGGVTSPFFHLSPPLHRPLLRIQAQRECPPPVP